jgi:hypothetical protein
MRPTAVKGYARSAVTSCQSARRMPRPRPRPRRAPRRPSPPAGSAAPGGGPEPGRPGCDKSAVPGAGAPSLEGLASACFASDGGARGFEAT